MGSPNACGRAQMSDIAKLHAVLFKLAKYGRVDDLRRKIYVLKLTPKQIQTAVNFVDKENACLVTAARNGHIDMVKFLLEQCHANVEQRGTVTFEHDKVESVTALWAAAAAGHQNLIEYLVLERGANVNARTSTNSTPLRAAAYDGNIQIVRFLIRHGANVDIPNKHGHTPLMIASYRGNVEVVRFLLNEGGADINRRSSRGNTALHDAAESNHIDVMKALLERGALLQRDVFDLDPLMSAASLGHYEFVRELCAIIDRFPQCQHVDDAQKVAAYELLGAALIDKKHNLLRAQQVWQESLRMRQAAAATAGDNTPATKTSRARSCSTLPQNTRSSSSSSLWPKISLPTTLAHIFHAEEFRTEADLSNVPFDAELAAAQAMLVRTRLVGAYHPETCYHLRHLGATFAEQGRLDRCVRLWEFVIDELSEHSEPLNAMLVSTFLSFVELFMLKNERDAQHDADDDEHDDLTNGLALHLNDKVRMQLLHRLCKEIIRGQKRLDKLKPLVEGRVLITPFARSFSTATNENTQLSSSVPSTSQAYIHHVNSVPGFSDYGCTTRSSRASTFSTSAYLSFDEQQQRFRRTPSSTSCKCDVVCNCAGAAEGPVEAEAAHASPLVRGYCTAIDAFADEVAVLDISQRDMIGDSDRVSTSSSVYSQNSGVLCDIHQDELLELDCERGNDLLKICDSCLMSPDFLEIKAAPTISAQHKLLYERYQKDLTSMSRLLTTTLFFADSLLAHFDTTLENTERAELIALMRSLVQLDVRGRQGRTLLHHAVTKNNAIAEAQMSVQQFSPSLLGFLVGALEAHVDAVDDNGSTPLCLSSQEQPMNEPIVKTLLLLGAHACLANHDRLSALRFLRTKPKLLYTRDCFPSLKCLTATKASELLPPDVLAKRADFIHMPAKIRMFLYTH